MKMLNNLLDKDFKVVEKNKILFAIPTIVILVALIVGVIYSMVFGSALNIGMDFSGGYTINLTLGNRLTDTTQESYYNQIDDIAESLVDADGNNYGLKIAQKQILGSGSDSAILIKYQAVTIPDDEDATTYMEEVNDAFEEALGALFAYNPLSVTADDGKYVAKFNVPIIDSICTLMLNALKTEADLSVTGATLSDDRMTITFTDASATVKNTDIVASAIVITDKYSGQAVKNDSVSAVISSELLIYSILAISVALVLMLVYIAFRFEISSGVAAVIALIHDVIIMMAFMVIFNIEISSVFIAALITILGYSINNTIIIFDRIRENTRAMGSEKYDPFELANRSVKETILRSINTTITTLLPIALIAIVGVSSIRVFALPIMIGLLAGTYSSICISPSIWALWKTKLNSSANSKAKGQRKIVQTVNE